MRLDARICLHKRDPAKNMARYDTLSVQPNLFSGQSAIREWGRIGQGHRCTSPCILAGRTLSMPS